MKKRTKDSAPHCRIESTALPALATAVLAACGGSEAPTNDLPQGITEHSVTAYWATTVGASDSPATQDLLTGGTALAVPN